MTVCVTFLQQRFDYFLNSCSQCPILDIVSLRHTSTRPRAPSQIFPILMHPIPHQLVRREFPFTKSQFVPFPQLRLPWTLTPQLRHKLPLPMLSLSVYSDTLSCTIIPHSLKLQLWDTLINHLPYLMISQRPLTRPLSSTTVIRTYSVSWSYYYPNCIIFPSFVGIQKRWTYLIGLPASSLIYPSFSKVGSVRRLHPYCPCNRVCRSSPVDKKLALLFLLLSSFSLFLLNKLCLT